MTDNKLQCFDPFGQTNARQCANVHEPVAQPMTLVFQYATAGEMAQGPSSVLVRHLQDGNEYGFERIFRLLVRVPNKRVESWALYRRAREWDETDDIDPGCVLRHVVWDAAVDMANQTWLVGAGPTLAAVTRYVNAAECVDFGRLFGPLDRALVNGFVLSNRPRTQMPTWQEISLWRSRDWGLIDLAWHSTMENAAAEAAGFDVAGGIEGALRRSETAGTLVQTMKMVYPATPYLVLS